ncbi:hypothetical protein [Streptomyces sp. NRRL F-5650]|jgi:hypothetical protein|uniref:hypothetical protein n=1 Tax=Streptomyces sp. NRRL F-5650 TaxID=1463868 RepID=UPI000B2E4613|nr:hypothetical protein [Streptomyces sp. NRRL F-5650]
MSGLESAVARTMSFGPSVGCCLVAASLALRARWAGGRVRTRLLLLAGSAVAGGGYRLLADALSVRPSAAGPDARPLLGPVVAVGAPLAVGLAAAGLVVAADAGAGRPVLLRRVLDGVVAAGAVFMAGWVLLRGAGGHWRLGEGMVGFLWAAELVFLSFLLALCRLVRSDRRATVWAGVVGLALILLGDTMQLWAVGPHRLGVDAAQVAGCKTAGLLVIAVGPWLPGGAGVLGTARPTLRWGMEGTAAFVPLTVCTVMALGHVLAPDSRDPVPLLVGGTVLLSLWVRQKFLPGEPMERGG